MLFVEQRIELALLLLRDAHAPARGPHGMQHHRIVGARDRASRAHQRELQIGVFAPGATCNASSNPPVRSSATRVDERIGGRELGAFASPAASSFVIGRDASAAARRYVRDTASAPARARARRSLSQCGSGMVSSSVNAMQRCERRAPARVARARRALRCRDRHIAHRRPASGPALRQDAATHALRGFVGSVVADDDLVASPDQRLRGKRAQAAASIAGRR